MDEIAVRHYLPPILRMIPCEHIGGEYEKTSMGAPKTMISHHKSTSIFLTRNTVLKNWSQQEKYLPPNSAALDRRRPSGEVKVSGIKEETV
ncbi:MAG: hypothetical protein AAB947_01055, partial [Patescibacteria group bacterium]